jgi:DNA adenine methylase
LGPSPSDRRRDSGDAGALAQPILKWAGGKRQLLPELRRFYPREFGAYAEPFLGSGAVFFDLLGRGDLAGRTVALSDTNPDVIGCYLAVRQRPAAVGRHLAGFAREYAACGASYYYEVRDAVFNPARQRLGTDARADRIAAAYTPELAAALIFLNRTGFNGLFRLNRQGAFNVPAGRYDRPALCDAAALRRVARAFGLPGLRLSTASFEQVLGEARTGDFLYLDPPYAPLSATARFTAYTAGGFTEHDQRRLQRAVIDAASRGCHVVLSNSTAPLVHDLYARNRAARAAGLRAHLVAARRAINCRAAARGAVLEFVISNVRPAYRRGLARAG